MAGPVHITAPRVSSSISSLDLNTDIANVSAEYFDFHASYEVRPAGAKGLGVYSREDLLPGSHVLTDSPVLVAYYDGRAKTSKNLSAEYSKLDAIDNEVWDSLAGSSACEDPVLDKFRANAFDLGGSRYAVYNHGSRFNHSCAPNCSITIFDDKLIVITRERVFEGQELTIQYDSDKSEELLEGRMGFNCLCNACNKQNKWYKRWYKGCWIM